MIEHIKQGRVEPRTSALNITLPAFAAERACVSARVSYRSISLSAANQPPAAAAVDRQDKETDGWTPDRYIDPAPHTMRRALINLECSRRRMQRIVCERTPLRQSHDPDHAPFRDDLSSADW